MPLLASKIGRKNNQKSTDSDIATVRAVLSYRCVVVLGWSFVLSVAMFYVLKHIKP